MALFAKKKELFPINFSSVVKIGFLQVEEMNRVPTWIIILFHTFILFLHSLFRPTLFNQIVKCICPNCQRYLSKLELKWIGCRPKLILTIFSDLFSFLADPHFPPWPAIFFQSTKFICMKCRIYLSKLQNVFVQIVGEMNWILTWIIIIFQTFILVLHSPLRHTVFFLIAYSICPNCKTIFFKLLIVFVQITKLFVQIAKSICPHCKIICQNCKMYLPKLKNVFCPNCTLYLSKLLNVFVQITKCIFPNWGGDEPAWIVIFFSDLYSFPTPFPDPLCPLAFIWEERTAQCSEKEEGKHGTVLQKRLFTIIKPTRRILSKVSQTSNLGIGQHSSVLQKGYQSQLEKYRGRAKVLFKLKLKSCIKCNTDFVILYGNFFPIFQIAPFLSYRSQLIPMCHCTIAL